MVSYTRFLLYFAIIVGLNSVYKAVLSWSLFILLFSIFSVIYILRIVYAWFTLKGRDRNIVVRLLIIKCLVEHDVKIVLAILYSMPIFNIDVRPILGRINYIHELRNALENLTFFPIFIYILVHLFHYFVVITIFSGGGLIK